MEVSAGVGPALCQTRNQQAFSVKIQKVTI